MLKRLKEARREAGITQREIARYIGKDQSHVSKTEAREREIGIVDLYNWCGALGIRFSEFAAQLEADIEELRRNKNNSSNQKPAGA